MRQEKEQKTDVYHDIDFWTAEPRENVKYIENTCNGKTLQPHPTTREFGQREVSIYL
jgi:hypothetical protein